MNNSVLDQLDASAAGPGRVYFPSGEDLAFTDLWAEAHRRAGWVRDYLGGESVVAGVLEPSPECISTLLGCWLAGRCFASLPERARGMSELEYVTQLNELRCLATASIVFMGADKSVDGAMRYPTMGTGRHASGGSGAGLLQFTSGSTGQPSPVLLGMTQIGANTHAISTSLQTASHDVFSSWLPLSHDMGLVGILLSSLAAFGRGSGGKPRLHLSEPRAFVRSPSSWLRTVEAVGATITMAPPFALALAASASAAVRDLSSLRCIVVGSDTVHATTLRTAELLLGAKGLRSGVICPGYGLAEATLAVTTVRPGEDWHTADLLASDGSDAIAAVSLGRAVPGAEVRIASDAKYGEIEVRGSGLGLTRGDQMSSDGWLRTGDEGSMRDGVLYFADRVAARIVVGGRVLPRALLVKRLEDLVGVRPGCCAPIGTLDGNYEIVLEPTESSSMDLAGLCDAVARRAVDATGAAPSRVTVVSRGTLPKTPSGKLQPGRIREHLATDSARPLAAGGYRRTHRSA